MTFCLLCQKAICSTDNKEKIHTHHTHSCCLSLATFEEELEKVLLKLTIVSSSAGMVRDNCRVFLWLWRGEERGFVRGEGRSLASLCCEVMIQKGPMNIWSFAADCVWALNTYNVSFERHLMSNARQ